MALQDLIDIECFEVLRGPQGALFGRNSEVGALNITTNRPSFTPSESFEASFGNDSFVQAKAILTGPIKDKVAFRTVLFDTNADGWLPNSYAKGFAAAAGAAARSTSQLPTTVQGAALTAGATSTLANYGVNGATSGYPLSASVANDNLSGSASLSYKLTPSTLLYAAFSNGYQAAALNLNAVVKAGIPAVVQLSTTDNYELGFKTSLFDHRLTLNADVYDEVLYGYQTTYSQVLANGTTLRYVANAGDVRSTGVEWDLTAALGYGVHLAFDGAYSNAHFQYAPSVAPPPEATTSTFNATGHAAPDAPKLTLSLTPSWDHRLKEHETFYSYAQYSYSSSFYSATNLSAYSVVPDQFTLNLRAGIRLEDGRYDVSLYANNATNQRNIYSKALLAVPATSIYSAEYQSLAPPAMHGVTLKAKY